MAHAGDQLLDREIVGVREAELMERELDVALMGIEGIEIDHDEDGVGLVRRHLAVEQHVVVGGVVEAQIVELMEGRILAAHPVHRGDQVLDVAGPVPIPDLVFVFLGVEILLGPRHGRVLAQLEAVIDAVDR
jgi:hypothetical protein